MTGGGFGLLGQSQPVTVSTPAPRITPAATTVVHGTSVNVTFANGPAGPTDWVALYPLGAAQSAMVDWKYLNGLQAAPGTGLSSGSFSFTMPNTPGAYQLVYYANNGWGFVARSAVITVQ
jgi:hypothetical protein